MKCNIKILDKYDINIITMFLVKNKLYKIKNILPLWRAHKMSHFQEELQCYMLWHEQKGKKNIL